MGVVSIFDRAPVMISSTVAPSYPPLLPGLGLSNTLDGSGIDLLPFLFELFHHLLGDRHRLPPVFQFVVQEPLRYVPLLLGASKPAGACNQLAVQISFNSVMLSKYVYIDVGYIHGC